MQRKTKTEIGQIGIFFKFIFFPMIGFIANISSVIELIESNEIRIGQMDDPDKDI